MFSLNSKRLTISLVIVVVLVLRVESHNKYSAAANTKEVETDDAAQKTFKTLDKPFRMNKINLLWGKAQLTLTENKLKSLYSDLKLHDKEEVTWKKLKAEGKDKDGLKEAELRNKLSKIMENYGLLQHFEEGHVKQKDNIELDDKKKSYLNKSLFKDKKLNKLWEKAEMAGFTSSELAALKEEFNHHQDKIDQYYSILTDAKNGPDDQNENSIDEKLEEFNTLDREDTAPKTDYLDKVNLLREHHTKLKDGYDRLHKLTASGPNSKEFIEPKVQGLWKIALESDFKSAELESLRIELMHYENRLLKLRHLHAEAALNESKHKEKMNLVGEKTNGMVLLQDNIKKQSRKVEKLHLDLETKIMRKHIEL